MYIYILTFSIRTQYYTTLTLGRGIVCDYKNIQRNWMYSSFKKTFAIQKSLMYTTPHVTTGGRSSSTDGLIWTKPLSVINTKNKSD